MPGQGKTSRLFFWASRRSTVRISAPTMWHGHANSQRRSIMLRRSWWWILGVLFLWAGPLQAQGAYRAGLASTDITPEGPIWMAGYGNRNKPSQGVDAPLRAKVFALQYEEEKPLVLITADIIGFSREVAEDIAGQL